MIREEGNLNIVMAEGDFGVYLPIRFCYEEDDVHSVLSTDVFTITIAKVNGTTETQILRKEFTGVEDGILRIFFSKEESNLLPIGRYTYSLDWSRSNLFMNNLVERQIFTVRDKVSKGEDDED